MTPKFAVGQLVFVVAEDRAAPVTAVIAPKGAITLYVVANDAIYLSHELRELASPEYARYYETFPLSDPRD